MACVVDVLMLGAEYKVGLVIFIVVPSEVLLIIFFFRAVILLGHFGPLLFILFFQNLHSLFLLIKVLLLHYKDVNQVLWLSPFNSLLNDFNLFSICLTAFICLVIVGVSIVYSLLLLGWFEFLSNGWHLVILSWRGLPYVLRIH